MSEIRNKIAPWQKQGRWYHAFIESDGTDYTLTSCDVTGAAIDTTDKTLKMPADFHVVDFRVDIHNDASSDVWYQKRTRLYSTGVLGCEIPGVAHFDYMDMFIFGYFED